MSHALDIALTCSVNGHPKMAEDILRKYAEDNPDDIRALFNLGWYDMRHGELRKGFAGMNAGRFIRVFGSEPISGPLWKDQPLENKVLLLRSEGGYGDEIINFRFAKDFRDRGATVVVAAHPHVIPLFAREGFACVTNAAVEAGGVYYDYWVPAMSAAYVLGHEFETLSGKPYLRAEPKYLPKKAGTIRVGLRWSGNPQFEHEQHRKFPPELLTRLHKTPGVTCYSFQRDQDMIPDLPFVQLDLPTFSETASLLAGMDLVITSCTSVAHLSAALGVETWIIVPVLPYYLWAQPGDRSKWYDSVRLFRQEVYGDWQAPLDQIKAELEKRVAIEVAA